MPKRGSARRAEASRRGSTSVGAASSMGLSRFYGRAARRQVVLEPASAAPLDWKHLRLPFPAGAQSVARPCGGRRVESVVVADRAGQRLHPVPPCARNSAIAPWVSAGRSSWGTCPQSSSRWSADGKHVAARARRSRSGPACRAFPRRRDTRAPSSRAASRSPSRRAAPRDRSAGPRRRRPRVPAA